MNRNKLIILSGISGVGKSTMARKLSVDHNISNVVSVDLLRAMFDPRCEENAMQYPLRVMEAWKIISEKKTSDSILLGLKSETYSICKHIRNMLAFCEKRGHHLILDGFHLFPSVFDDVCGEFDTRKITICGISKENLEKRQISRAKDTHLNSKTKRTKEEIELFLHLDNQFRHSAEISGWSIIDANLDREEMLKVINKQISTLD